MMRNSLRFLVLFALLLPLQGRAQVIKLQEGFETSDSLHLPAGWTKWYLASLPIDSLENWTVRDTGLALPGIAAPRTSKAHSGTKAVGVSWRIGNGGVGDAWLITRKITGITAGDSLRFWATGSNGPCTEPQCYLDSIEVWISVDDSTPATQLVKLGGIVWPHGSLYGNFKRYAFYVGIAAGFPVWIGFRYYGDWSVEGYFVHLDDISVAGPTSVEQTDPNVPERFGLLQNYPNPFNPTTSMEFRIPKSSYTTLKIYNALGQEVATLVDEQLSPGTFKAEWDARLRSVNSGEQASGMASGMYFARLTAGQYTETRKLMLVK
jgi:hypothetical protein